MDAWAPLFEVATKDLDADGPAVRRVLDDLCSKVHCDRSGYRLDSEAQFAMGWWFFAMYVQEDFAKRAAEYVRVLNPDAAATGEYGMLEYMKSELKRAESTAVIKLNSKRSPFTRYWTWLLR